jgi:integrase
MSQRTKRKHNEGSFRCKASGLWEGSRWITELGCRVYVSAESEAKARTALERRVNDVRRGDVSAKTPTITFDEYARQVIMQRENLKDRTRDLYLTNLRLYLAPLHHHKLGAITPAMLRTHYATLRARGLSDVVRGHAHTLARLVLETARHDGLIQKNPASTPGIRPKSQQGATAKPVEAYDTFQAARIVEAAAGVTHGELVVFLLLTGMRRGEALALRWEAVDLVAKRASVELTRSISGGKVYEGSPKTKRSRRQVPLSEDLVTLLEALKITNAERHAALYPERPACEYVFANLTGGPHRPDNVRRTLQQILTIADQQILKEETKRAEDAGEPQRHVPPMPRLRVHALRHTFVSLMAAANIRLEVIAQWIGDDASTVMRVYLHVFQQDTAMPSLQLGKR